MINRTIVTSPGWHQLVPQEHTPLVLKGNPRGFSFKADSILTLRPDISRALLGPPGCPWWSLISCYSTSVDICDGSFNGTHWVWTCRRRQSKLKSNRWSDSVISDNVGENGSEKQFDLPGWFSWFHSLSHQHFQYVTLYYTPETFHFPPQGLHSLCHSCCRGHTLYIVGALSSSPPQCLSMSVCERSVKCYLLAQGFPKTTYNCF